jgi:hypothetical protein
MDQNGPPVPPSDFVFRSAFLRTAADIDPPPEPCGNERCEGHSVAVYYRDEAEVGDGFLIALRAMEVAGVEQHSEPATPPIRGAKP